MSEKAVVNPLEQFVLLAKSAKGAAAVALIRQALEAPGVYVFGELLSMPNIEELSEGPNAGHYQLLNLFAYGTYSQYKAKASEYPELTPAQTTKLKHLSIVSLATQTKCIPYSLLLRELELKNMRELEDLIIEVIYADIVHGKLDQKNQVLEVDYCLGRDMQPEHVKNVVQVLQEWCDTCDNVLLNIEQQIVKANDYKENRAKQREKVELEIAQIKSSLKSGSQTQDYEEQMVTESRDATSSSSSEKPGKKPSKTKGLRGSSGKFWKS